MFGEVDFVMLDLTSVDERRSVDKRSRMVDGVVGNWSGVDKGG